MVEATMAGSNIITYKKDTSTLSLSEKTNWRKNNCFLSEGGGAEESAPEQAAFLGIADFRSRFRLR